MKEKIQLVIEEVIRKVLNLENIKVEVMIPKDPINGDYSTPVALSLAKKVDMGSIELANLLKDAIDDEIFVKIEVKQPGFLNFFVKKDYLFENMYRVLSLKEKYGSSNFGNNEKINLEYVSANPTGTLHLGHARGAAYGDSLARILSFAGFDVTREYYINDAGNQMMNLAKSIKARYLEACHMECEFPEDGYHGPEIINLGNSLFNEYQDSKVNEDSSYFKEIGLTFLMDQIKKDLADFRVSFDVFTSETSLYDRGLVKDAVSKLTEEGYTYQEDGATFLKTTLFGDSKDRVLVKQDGAYTYLVPDIAYHKNKYSRGFFKLIDVLGADHHGYIPRLKASIQMMNEDPSKLEVKIIQMVRLIKNGEELKMSKRTGNAITIQELTDEIGVDAARYFFSNRSIDTMMDLDIDLALKKSNDNPVYYVNYAHARCSTILNEYSNITLDVNTFDTLNSVDAYNVLTKVYSFPEIVQKAAVLGEVHLITNYAYELASLFHTFYAKEKIIKDDNLVYTKEHLAFIKAVQITLFNALQLIGVEAYKSM